MKFSELLNSKYVMIVSAFYLGITGILLLFLPQEFLTAIQLNNTIEFEIVLQILGSVYLGFAILNWNSRFKIIGGIYSRPLVLANFTHSFIVAITLLKNYSHFQNSIVYLTLTAIYFLSSVLFGKLMFTHPSKHSQ